MSLLVADNFHLSSLCAFFLAPVTQEVWPHFVPMLFASNEHGLRSHTMRFAFLSHKPCCASGVDLVPLSSDYLGACQGGWAICLENMVGDGCWDRALWDHGVTCSMLLRQWQYANEPHTDFLRPSSIRNVVSFCVYKDYRLCHLQSQTVCRGNPMTKFWFYILFFALRRFLRTYKYWTDL